MRPGQSRRLFFQLEDSFEAVQPRVYSNSRSKVRKNRLEKRWRI